MADSQTIAKGNVTISANADPMVKGLKQAEAKTSEFAKGVNQRMQAVFTGFGAGLLGGGLSEVIKGAVEETGKIVSGLRDMESHAEQASIFLERIEKTLSNSAKHADEWRAAMVSSSDRIAAIDAEMTKVRDDTKSFRADWKSVDTQLQKTAGINWSSFGDFMMGSREGKLDTLMKTANEYAKTINTQVERGNKLLEERNKLLNPWENDPDLKGSFDRKLKELNDAMVDAPLSANQRMIRQFQEKGVPNELIKQLEQRVVQYEAVLAQLEAEKSFKPQRFGILETALQAFDIVKDQVADMKPEKPKWFAEAFTEGSAGAYSLDVANRFGFDTTDAAATQREQLAELKRLTKASENAYEEMRTLNKQLGEAV